MREGDTYGTKRAGFWIVDEKSIDAFYTEDDGISVGLMRRVGQNVDHGTLQAVDWGILSNRD